MFKSVISGAVYGVSGRLITVEADVSNGFPAFTMVGYLASEVREAKERVLTAIKNTGTAIPAKRMVVNMAPADIRKQGTAFDLAVALAMLAAMGKLSEKNLKETMVVGELGLQGRVIGVRGVLPLALLAKEKGMKRMIVPIENQQEACAVGDVEVIGVETLSDAVNYLMTGSLLESDALSRNISLEEKDATPSKCHDFSELMGQERLKRAIELAIAGGHHLLMIGPPGIGKSMAAKCIPSILSPLSEAERMEVTRIHSVAGLVRPGSGLVKDRPFRSPHHSASAQSLVGGGRFPMPGEISLAHTGVLFLDELTEFNRRTIEMLRQPLEDGEVTISRVYGNYTFPASFILVAAMNPCPCGYFPDRTKCRCTINQIKSYLNHVSFPILDRFDITIEASPIRYEDMTAKKPGMDSKRMRAHIEKARQMQRRRLKNDLMTNARMDGESLKQFCCLDARTEKLLETIYKKEDMSTRGYCKLLRTARTAADIDGSDMICEHHIYEAAGYRTLDKRYWRNI